MTPVEMGGGEICPTITGDHNAHISDYTAIVVVRTLLPATEHTGKESER